jgi:hypothetical protein
MVPRASWWESTNGALMAQRPGPSRSTQKPRSGNYPSDLGFVMSLHPERVTRIELALSAWEADVLPLNYTRAAGLPAAEKVYLIRSGDGTAGPARRSVRRHAIGTADT